MKKKIVAATAILTMALAGTPQAAAQANLSSMSSMSSAPSVVQPIPSPMPTPGYYDLNDVNTRIGTGYAYHFTNRGYVHSDSADRLAYQYATGTPTARAYLLSETAAAGFDIEVVTFPTSAYMDKYNELMSTPRELYKGELYGGYILSAQDTVTVTILTTG